MRWFLNDAGLVVAVAIGFVLAIIAFPVIIHGVALLLGLLLLKWLLL